MDMWIERIKQVGGYGWTDRWIDGWIDIQTDGHMDRETSISMDMQTHEPIDIYAFRKYLFVYCLAGLMHFAYAWVCKISCDYT